MADDDLVEISPGVFRAASEITPEERESADALSKRMQAMANEIRDMVSAYLAHFGLSTKDPLPVPPEAMVHHTERTFFKMQSAVDGMRTMLDEQGVPRPGR